VHSVFVTKYRRGVPGDATLTCCETATGKANADFGAEPREFNGEAGHVHLLVEYPPGVAVSALVNPRRGVSGCTLRSQFTGRVNRASMRGHVWSPSYFATSCGAALLSIIRPRNQS
jgi:putative transposase